jgi:CRISPR-associated protein Cmr2
MTTPFHHDDDFWSRKLSYYLHDPPDKALKIPGHEERSRELCEELNLPSPNKEAYQRADRIASGMDRTQLPGYDKNPRQSGAINFLENPVLTHPTGGESSLTLHLDLPASEAGKVHGEILRTIREDTDRISTAFPDDPHGMAAARFHYIHHALRDRLREQNIGGLGGLWNRIPADTRIPDHSIWQHCGLVSSLATCFHLMKSPKASLMVFSITPVQDFIGRARKLRDFWTGSLILSWLAFEGIRQVIYHLGSDHVLYPSLMGQPMVNRLLRDECGLGKLEWGQSDELGEGVASFPNKFVSLVPEGQEEKLAGTIQNGITEAWMNLGRIVREKVDAKTRKNDSGVADIFRRQMADFFSFHWSACPLLDESATDSIQTLLPPSIWSSSREFTTDSKGLPFPAKGEGAHYPVTHALAQSFLAAGKTRQTDTRVPEEGIKCPLHGDMEILHYAAQTGKNPRPEDDPFWVDFKAGWGEHRPDFKTSERLSAIAMVKRIGGITLKDAANASHPLHPFFAGRTTFPSTTEVALTGWFNQVEKIGKPAEFLETPKWRELLAEYLHEEDDENGEEADEAEIIPMDREEKNRCREFARQMKEKGLPVTDADKYFAILLMDGDHMGKLVNGETLASRWETVIHPELAKKLLDSDIAKSYKEFWSDYLKKKRLLAPSLHAAISESLGDFSLRTVPAIVKKYQGKLVYAGGDDVCAFLPVATVLDAAREIADAYQRGFVAFSEENQQGQAVAEEWKVSPDRLMLHLGRGDDISISAGILLWHHKRPLSVAMSKAHELLETAKNEGDRNAMALELAKRSGGSRRFICKWGEAPSKELGVGTDAIVEHFLRLAAQFGGKQNGAVSSSLLYRMEALRPALEALGADHPEKIRAFVEKQIKTDRERPVDSDEPGGEKKAIAESMAALLFRSAPESTKSRPVIETESMVIARFLGPIIANCRTLEEIQ